MGIRLFFARRFVLLVFFHLPFFFAPEAPIEDRIRKEGARVAQQLPPSDENAHEGHRKKRGENDGKEKEDEFREDAVSLS